MKQLLKKCHIEKIIFSRKFFILLFSFFVAANMQAQKVSGTVIDENNEPLVGVTVSVKGTKEGMPTDLNGKFSLNAPDVNAVLTFQSLGYKTQELKVSGRTDITVIMYEDQQLLNEVVVVGFQSQRKVNLTGAITAVGAEAFENRPVSNIGQALQGVVPNLNISISNGAPNTVPSFNIRGGTSIEYNTTDSKWEVKRDAPLILVDGVEYSETMLNQMNPNDIESMSVIKDAAAAAIYGTKATYGVMLIQTKSGKFGQKGKVSYSYDLSFDKPSAIPDILDAYTLQNASMNKTTWTGGAVGSSEQTRLEAIKKYMDNPVPENAWYMDGSSIQWVANMNPYNILLRDQAPTQKHNLSIQGGSDRITYYVSLGYQNGEGLYKIGEDVYNRYNGMIRVNAKVKEWFNIEGRLNYNRTTYDSPYLVGGKGNVWAVMKNETGKNINMPLMTGPNDPIPNAYTDNILSWLSYGARSKSTATTTAMSLSPEFIIIPQVLKVKADLSFTPQSTVSERHSPEHSYVTVSWNNTVAEQSEAQEHRGRLLRNSTDNYLVNAYLDFNKTFAGKHFVSAVLGYNQELEEYGELIGNLRGLFSPDILKPGAAEDITLHTIETSAQRRTGRAVFGGINYVYNDRYMFEVKNRYDGSSRFTKKERFVSFPAFSAGWRISEENFMDFTNDWLDNLKIKGSWGKLGSQPSKYYPYQATMGSGNASYFIDGKWASYVGAPGLVSPALTWQKATTTNFGIEANVLKNRLDVEYNIYKRKVTDILLDGEVPYPSVLGATPPTINSGILDAYGWELTLNWRNRLANGLSYRIGLVLSDEQTKVVKFTGNPEKLLSTLYDGMVTGNIWGYETGGILQESDLTPNPSRPGAWLFYGPSTSGATYWPGYIWYKDINSDGIINTGANTLKNHGDKKLLGNNTSRYRYGITGDVSYKGFDLSLFFQGVGKRDLWISNSWYWGSGAGSLHMYNNSWTPERTNAKYPMYNYTTVGEQSAYIINGAYIRLKQAILGYTLPQSLTKKLGVEKLRFNLAGYNLFDITDIPDVFDPDQISDAYPQKRTISLGAQITF
ncbi:MAG: TonB-dependent receptor [Dysgonamonadaceae bacterium]|jgi:TonB-linked SusC/RagA family outer membrane protein|nr:TonB-dependent receptor [Dysgonamonadaceae bacterium]